MDIKNIIISRKNISAEDIPPMIGKNLPDHLNLITLPVIDFQKIKSKEVKETLAKITRSYYDYCIFLSSNSIDIFFEIIRDEKESKEILHELSRMKIIAIGPKTKYTLKEYGFESQLADNHSNNYSMTGINNFLHGLESEMKIQKQYDAQRILIPRSAQSIKSGNFIKSTFKNIELDQVFFYDISESKNVFTSPEWKEMTRVSAHSGKTFLIFTSPSAVRSFFKIMYQLSPQLYYNKSEVEIINDLKIYKVISIGPITSRALIDRKITHIESSTHTIKGTLEVVFNEF